MSFWQKNPCQLKVKLGTIHHHLIDDHEVTAAMMSHSMRSSSNNLRVLHLLNKKMKCTAHAQTGMAGHRSMGVAKCPWNWFGNYVLWFEQLHLRHLWGPTTSVILAVVHAGSICSMKTLQPVLDWTQILYLTCLYVLNYNGIGMLIGRCTHCGDVIRSCALKYSNPNWRRCSWKCVRTCMCWCGVKDTSKFQVIDTTSSGRTVRISWGV
jgi:hypothetical protein